MTLPHEYGNANDASQGNYHRLPVRNDKEKSQNLEFDIPLGIGDHPDRQGDDAEEREEELEIRSVEVTHTL